MYLLKVIHASTFDKYIEFAKIFFKTILKILLQIFLNYFENTFTNFLKIVLKILLQNTFEKYFVISKIHNKTIFSMFEIEIYCQNNIGSFTEYNTNPGTDNNLPITQRRLSRKRNRLRDNSCERNRTHKTYFNMPSKTQLTFR